MPHNKAPQWDVDGFYIKAPEWDVDGFYNKLKKKTYVSILFSGIWSDVKN